MSVGVEDLSTTKPKWNCLICGESVNGANQAEALVYLRRNCPDRMFGSVPLPDRFKRCVAILEGTVDNAPNPPQES